MVQDYNTVLKYDDFRSLFMISTKIQAYVYFCLAECLFVKVFYVKPVYNKKASTFSPLLKVLTSETDVKCPLRCP